MLTGDIRAQLRMHRERRGCCDHPACPLDSSFWKEGAVNGVQEPGGAQCALFDEAGDQAGSSRPAKRDGGH